MACPDTFYIKQNDTSPAMLVTLQDGSGTAVDLSGASVRFHMYTQDRSTEVVDAAANLVTPASGVVRYDWDAADTITSGTFIAEFEVTYADSTVETFPNLNYIKVQITKELA